MTGDFMSINKNTTIQDYISKYWEFKNSGSKYPTIDVYEFYNLQGESMAVVRSALLLLDIKCPSNSTKIRIELVERHSHNRANFDSLKLFLKDSGASNIRIINKSTNQPIAYTCTIDVDLIDKILDTLDYYHISIWDRNLSRWFNRHCYPNSGLSESLSSLYV